MAATTTRKINKPSTKNLSLFMYLLPSLIRTLDCGFRYEYVLGYDKGDPFYDSKEVSESCLVEFISALCIMHGPLARTTLYACPADPTLLN